MRIKKAVAALTVACATAIAVLALPTPARAEERQVPYISVLKPWNGGSATMVLDRPHNSTANLTQVQLWEYRASPSQQWRVDAMYLWGKYGSNSRAYKLTWSGSCLDRRTDLGIGNGNIVQMYQCHGGANQIWWEEKVNSSAWSILRNDVDGRCLDVRDLQYYNGTKLQVWDCSKNWNQRFNIH